MNGYPHPKSKKPGKNNAYNLVFLAKALSLVAMLLITLTSASAQVEFRDSSGFDFYNELTLQSEDLNIENGNLTMNNNRILGLPEPNSSGEPLTYGGGSGEYVDRDGDSMTGDLDLQDNYLIGNAANLSFGGSNLEIGGGSFDLTDAQNIIMNGGSITSINQLAGQSGSAITIGSNLDFQDTYSLKGVAGIADCTSEEVLAGDGSCITPSTTLSEVLNEGNSAGSTDLNMSGNIIEEVSQVTGKMGEYIAVGAPGLDMMDNEIKDLDCIGDHCSESNRGLDIEDSNGLNVYTNNGTSFTVDSNGNVGVGTDNPQEDLHIEGGLKVSELSSKGLADYSIINSPSPILEIEAGHRSYDGLPISIPSNSIDAEITSDEWYDNSEASQPDGEWEYKYFYALVSDTNKVSVSDNPPASDNSRIIGGEEHIYIGAARYYSEAGSSSEYSQVFSNGEKIIYNETTNDVSNLYDDNQGLEIFHITGESCSYNNDSIDLTNYIPETADELELVHGTSFKVRCDGGCQARFDQRLTESGSNEWIYRNKAHSYVETPVDGEDYYPVPYSNQEFVELQREFHELSNMQFYSSSTHCYTDNWSGHAAGVMNYIDSKIY